jgi:hypothetical protein
MLTVDLWDTVARVADGFEPDDQDRAVLRAASIALRGQAEAIVFVDGDAVGTEPKHPVMGLDALVDMVWRAATQLELRRLLGKDPEPVSGLQFLADALDRIADGDTVLAKTYDPLVERLSRLAEQTASTEASYSV